MTMQRSPVSLSVSIDQKAIARVTKRLDQWQGAPLAKRVDKAIQGGLRLLVAPIRAGAARHRITGETERSVSVKKLRKRAGEIVAYMVGVRKWYGRFPIAGTSRGVEADPYVNQAVEAHGGQVQSFIDQQVIRLA